MAVVWAYAVVIVCGATLAVLLIMRHGRDLLRQWPERSHTICERPVATFDGILSLLFWLGSRLVFYMAGMLLCVVYLLERNGHSWHQVFGVRHDTWRRDSMQGLTAFLVMMPVLLLAALVWQAGLSNFQVEITCQESLKFMKHDKTTPIALVSMILMSVLWAPLIEELWFRGIFLPLFARRIGMIGAILLQALFFAMLHEHLPAIATLFVLGTALGLVYVCSGSILTAVVLHAVFNAFNILMFMML